MWLPKEGKFILLFSNKISESGISAWATTRGRPYKIIFMQPNNNLPVCFLLGHSDNPIPEYFHRSGVAMRPNNNLLQIPADTACRVATVTYSITYSIQVRSAIFRKAAVCGEAAQFPCLKHGK